MPPPTERTPVTYTTTALLFLEREPTPEQEAAITAVVAANQRFVRLDAAEAGPNPFVAAVYAAAFNYVTPTQIGEWVAKLPIADAGDVILYARPEAAYQATFRVRERVVEAPADA